MLLVKYTAIFASFNLLSALVIQPLVAPGVCLLRSSFCPYASEQGLGRDIKITFVGRNHFEQLITLILYGLRGRIGLAAFALASLTVWFGAHYILRLIPGLTGDSYGAVCEGIELIILLLFATRGIYGL